MPEGGKPVSIAITRYGVDGAMVSSEVDVELEESALIRTS